jgi:hypothetical protein
MNPIRVGLVADPSSPTEVARRIGDLQPHGGGDHGGGDHGAWVVEVVSEPFTTGSEDIDTALARLGDRARQHEWDIVVGLTELPLRPPRRSRRAEGRILPAQRPRPGPRPRVLDRRTMTIKGVNFQPVERGQFSTGVDRSGDCIANEHGVHAERETVARLVRTSPPNRMCVKTPGSCVYQVPAQ